MTDVDLLPELAERLERLVPAENLAPDWTDILRRVAPARPPQRKRRQLRLVLVAFTLLLLLAGIATGTYFALRGGGGGRAEGLTMLTGDPTPPPSNRRCRVFGCGPEAAIGAVQPDGRLKILWRCPHPGYSCGDLTSMAWSADGRKLAFTMDEVGGNSGYIGLHIVDALTGRDLQLPRVGPGDTARQQSGAFFPQYRRRALREVGCPFPDQVAWSADGATLAYVCGFPGAAPHSGIFVIRADGSRRRLVRTGSAAAAFPSLSPDGTRVAFATGMRPRDSGVYVVRLDGTDRKLLARHGTAPAWAPDGRTVAYRATCGLRLVTPAGTDVTPAALIAPCRQARPGYPAWSPDSTKLAFAAPHGVYVVNANGADLTRVTQERGRGAFGLVRPAWTPTPRVVRSHQVFAGRQRCC